MTYPFNPGSGGITLPLAISQGGTGQTSAAAAFNALNPNAAPIVATPANPAGTTSTTLVMCGIAQPYTPTGSGLVVVIATGQCAVSASGANNEIIGRYGTGTAPANGAAVTGTAWGANATPTVKATGATSPTQPFAFTDLLTLTPGTAYWFDLAQATTASAETVTYTGIKIVIAELPAG